MQHTITFTQQVKEEVVSNEYHSKDRLRALLAAFIKINGALTFKNKESYLLMSTENAKIAKFIYSSLKAIYEASDEELLALKIPKRVIDNIRSVLKNEINN